MPQLNIPGSDRRSADERWWSVVNRFRLERAVFEAADVVWSEEPHWRSGELGLNLEKLAARASKDRNIANVRVDVARPGDPLRLVNVLDVVEPQVKSDLPEATFPGAAGRLAVAGQGRTTRVSGVAVVSCAEFLPSDDPSARDIQNAVIDMAGPGASYTPWSETTNVVLTYGRNPLSPLVDVDAAIRKATLEAAKGIAEVALGQEPSRLETLGPIDPCDEDLPSVALILQLGGESPLYDTFFYGTTIRERLPMIVEPTEVLDGSIVAGAYHWAALRNPTYCYQTNRLILELVSAHGRRLDFRGVVITRAYFMSAEDKWRNALLAAKLATQLGADGAILTTDAGGNSHTDTMLTCRACEQLGVRTVVLTSEMGGLTDYVPEADAIVSTGNAEEFVSEWTPDAVIGGSQLVDGRAADEAGPIRVLDYVAAANQMGQAALQGGSW
jgi:glycine reductase complex component B subunit alpha and beta